MTRFCSLVLLKPKLHSMPTLEKHFDNFFKAAKALTFLYRLLWARFVQWRKRKSIFSFFDQICPTTITSIWETSSVSNLSGLEVSVISKNKQNVAKVSKHLLKIFYYQTLSLKLSYMEIICRCCQIEDLY